MPPRVTLAPRAQRLAVEQMARVVVTLANEGATPTTVALSAAGVPPHWLVISSTPATLRAGATATILVAVSPPRLSGSRAGDYALTLGVTSPEFPGWLDEQTVRLTLDPFDQFDLSLVPRASDTWSARLVNRGNRPLPLRLTATSDEGYRSRLDDAPLTLAPGEAREVPLRLASAPRGARVARVRVTATPLLGDAPPQTVPLHLAPAAWRPPARRLGALLALLLLVAWWAAHGTEGAGSRGSALPLPVEVGARLPEPPRVHIGPAWRDPLPPLTPLPTITLAPTASPAPFPSVPVAATPPPMALVVPTSVGPTEAPTSAWTYEALFRTVGAEFGLDWWLLASVAFHESRLNPAAVGGSGEMGLMQVMPDTWELVAPQLGVTDPFDPYSNARVGAAYLALLRDMLAGSGYEEAYWMLVAYNWGPANLQRLRARGDNWGSVPRRPQDYVYEVIADAGDPSGPWWREALQQPVYDAAD